MFAEGHSEVHCARILRAIEASRGQAHLILRTFCISGVMPTCSNLCMGYGTSPDLEFNESISAICGVVCALIYILEIIRFVFAVPNCRGAAGFIPALVGSLLHAVTIARTALHACGIVTASVRSCNMATVHLLIFEAAEYCFELSHDCTFPQFFQKLSALQLGAQ